MFSFEQRKLIAQLERDIKKFVEDYRKIDMEVTA